MISLGVPLDPLVGMSITGCGAVSTGFSAVSTGSGAVFVPALVTAWAVAAASVAIVAELPALAVAVAVAVAVVLAVVLAVLPSASTAATVRRSPVQVVAAVARPVCGIASSGSVAGVGTVPSAGAEIIIICGGGGCGG